VQGPLVPPRAAPELASHGHSWDYENTLVSDSEQAYQRRAPKDIRDESCWSRKSTSEQVGIKMLQFSRGVSLFFSVLVGRGGAS
jgi:hypothetical protein